MRTKHILLAQELSSLANELQDIQANLGVMFDNYGAPSWGGFGAIWNDEEEWLEEVKIMIRRAHECRTKMIDIEYRLCAFLNCERKKL